MGSSAGALGSVGAGAGIGFAVGGPVGAGIGGGLGLLSSLSASQAGEAQAGIAAEQAGVAGRERAFAIRAAQPSARELQTIEQLLGSAESALSRQEALLARTDPALAKAAEEAERLLSGGESRLLGPIREQRQRQREQLENRLRKQLGPGFETSTAGQQTLREFERQTRQLQSQAQLQTLGQLLPTTLAARGQTGQFMGAAGQAFGAAREPARTTVQAALGSPTAGFAGGQFLPQLAQAQSQQQLLGTIIGGASKGFGAGAGQAAGASLFG